MHSLHLHIIGTFLLLISGGITAFGQTLEENYNNGSINQRENDCWEFNNFEINNANPINAGGGEKKHGATVNMDAYSSWPPSKWFSESSFSTPFVYFDGTGTLSFKHKADVNDFAAVSAAGLSVVLIDPYGNQVAPDVLDHPYKQSWPFTQYPNGSPEITQNESIPVTWTGYYRVEWTWSDVGDADTEYFIDDIVIDTSGVPFYETDTVCFNETVQHTPADAVSNGAPYNFEYTWSWVGTSGGTLTTQTTNYRTAQVDWNVGPGTYRLKSVETYNNGSCNGRTFYIDVTVNDQPDFEIELDTVCEGFAPTMIFDGLVGKAPFTVTYNDGSGSKTFVSSGSSESVLLAIDAADVNITDVVDDNGCHADPSLLKVYPIYYHPKPSTNPIYHY